MVGTITVQGVPKDRSDITSDDLYSMTSEEADVYYYTVPSESISKRARVTSTDIYLMTSEELNVYYARPKNQPWVMTNAITTSSTRYHCL